MVELAVLGFNGCFSLLGVRRTVHQRTLEHNPFASTHIHGRLCQMQSFHGPCSQSLPCFAYTLVWEVRGTCADICLLGKKSSCFPSALEEDECPCPARGWAVPCSSRNGGSRFGLQLASQAAWCRSHSYCKEAVDIDGYCMEGQYWPCNLEAEQVANCS